MNGGIRVWIQSVVAFRMADPRRVYGHCRVPTTGMSGGERTPGHAGPRAPDGRRTHRVAEVQASAPCRSARQTWRRRTGAGPALNGGATLVRVFPVAREQLH